jgi:hypothetical protein
MGSSRKSTDQILGVISKKDAERLLLSWVHLPSESDMERAPIPGPIERMLSLFPKVFADFQDCQPEKDTHNEEHVARGARRMLLSFLVRVRDSLRRVWDAPDSRQRDWEIFLMRMLFHQNKLFLEKLYTQHLEPENRALVAEEAMKFNRRVISLPDATPFEATMFYLQTFADKTRHCPNPMCPAPYFLAEKRSQKYCSEACAGPGLREAKRRWWNENRAKKRNTDDL